MNWIIENLQVLATLGSALAVYTFIRIWARKEAKEIRQDLKEVKQDIKDLKENVSSLDRRISHIEGHISGRAEGRMEGFLRLKEKE